ncbi:hypothetical protein C8J55DRAFT_38610 [Lentinula edodes]|uniref:F-box domain-containing protein n=1 Tax=Lentinula lateritia TaxID=40482 RepID=A0A9W9DT49_9AGAR|nr:hypothetical protein C8J55DRAFT_38610 [Lentinula edodes]
MPNRPHKFINSSVSKSTSSSLRSSTQHGLLCSIPAETLAHITAYLDPPSLFALSQVNRALYGHIGEDHTWHRAFLLHFLGILPESNIHSKKALVLRRIESSWRKEYVSRFNLIRRWERSRNTTIAHVPVYSSISRMHLMPLYSLISSSVQYGIVSRSIPLTGKVIKGFLSPSLSGNGLGIGNPNTEFAPNVTACALSSDGGTAKIVWGFRNGAIAVMTAAKTMETGTRSAGRLTRCKVEEEHEAEVNQVEWDETGCYIVSAARDGRIKVWDAKEIRCLWTSQYFSPNICVSVVLLSNPEGYMVVSTMDSGEIWVWLRITLTVENVLPSPVTSGSPNIRIPYPIQDNDTTRAPSSLYVDNIGSPSGVYVFVTYQSRQDFWGIYLEYTSSSYKVSKYFSDEASGAVTALFPCFCGENSPDERGFVIAGHQMGWITVYPQIEVSVSRNVNIVPLITATQKFEAHPDGSAVTALAWNGRILVTGSDFGDTSIFDACSFRRLRVLNSPLSPTRIRNIGLGSQGEAFSGGVNQILLGEESDFLVASVGDHALAFKADALPKYGKRQSGKAAGKKKPIRTVKGYERILFDQLITESLKEHGQKSQHLRKVYAREREHQANLDRLGLDEVEALEYALMLSRDEAVERARVDEGTSQHHIRDSPYHVMDDGVFEGEFDDFTTELPTSSQISTSATQSVPVLSGKLLSTSVRSTGTMQTPKSKSMPIEKSPHRTSPSSSDRKIQVHPPARRKPQKADFGDELIPSSVASSISSSANSTDSVSKSAIDGGAFPSISPARSINGAPSPPRMSLSSSTSVGGSVAHGAWAKPLVSNSSASPWSGSLPAASSPMVQTAAPSSVPSVHGQGVDDDIDDDIKLAIRLSLESAENEARRRRA